MMVASEAAGGTSSPANARIALLAAVFEAHPDLDGRDLENYMAVRGLVSDKSNVGRGIDLL